MDRRTALAGLAATLALPALAVPARAATPDLRFRDLYSRGTRLSDYAASLEGQRIEMTGYMAPPLKPEIDFFVLTRMPMAVCPFCSDAADWPTDLVVSYSRSPLEVVRYSDLIRVEGRFETGIKTDPDTGFVSLVRLMDVSYRKL